MTQEQIDAVAKRNKQNDCLDGMTHLIGLIIQELRVQFGADASDEARWALWHLDNALHATEKLRVKHER